MKSKLAPPCYSSFDGHLCYLGPVSCAFSSWVSSVSTTLEGEAAKSWWLQHPLFTDVAGGIFSACQIFTRNYHILILQSLGYTLIVDSEKGNEINDNWFLVI